VSNKLKVAVIGAGSLGKEHARLYASLPETELTGICDLNRAQAERVAEKCRTQVFDRIEQAIDAADAFSIVTPTNTHFEIARRLLTGGKHVLVEKPMTETSAQAAELVELARAHQAVLQVGHVERFNPAFRYMESVATEPRFIEAHRLSPYPGRSTDIGVVLDLMIHDLDVVLAFVKSPVASLDSVGIPVLSTTEDIANTRIRFENGCVANLTASRVSAERMRKIRVFSGGPNTSYVSLDYRAQEGFIYRIAREGEEESSILKKLLAARDSTIVSEFNGKRIVREPVPIEKDEPLKLELQSFVRCILQQQTPIVSGESGKRALDLAMEITRQIQAPRPPL
jgi:predicted dehydrogenase